MDKKNIYTQGEFPYWPNKIIIGCGARKRVLDEIRKFKGNSVFFCTDKNLLDLPMTYEFINHIKKSGVRVYTYSDIEENPSDCCVEKAVECIKKFKPDVFVYFGGGSVIDLGKAANLVYTHGGQINEYEDLVGGIEKINDRMLPAIAIPTTAGSGSEVSSVSVITDSNRKVKMGILSPYIVPDVSILDAEVTVELPRDLTAYTGMDALTHCIEAYVSNINFEPGKGIAYQGIKLVKKNLFQAVQCGSDLLARENMLVASACGSMAFNNNYLGTVHACAHQLSTVAGIPHGLGNAIMLLPVMRWNLKSNIASYAEVAQALGVDIYSISSEEAAQKGIEEIEKIERMINIPQHLSDIGVSIDMIEELANKAYNDHNNLSNPRCDGKFPNPVSKDAIRELFLEVI